MNNDTTDTDRTDTNANSADSSGSLGNSDNGENNTEKKPNDGASGGGLSTDDVKRELEESGITDIEPGS